MISYVSDCAVIVLLQNSIEAFLHIKQVPQLNDSIEATPSRSRYRGITEEISIGDRLRGEIISVDSNRLEVHIDLRPVLNKKEEDAKRRRSMLVKCQALDEPEIKISDSGSNLNGITLWSVDEDSRF